MVVLQWCRVAKEWKFQFHRREKITRPRGFFSGPTHRYFLPRVPLADIMSIGNIRGLKPSKPQVHIPNRSGSTSPTTKGIGSYTALTEKKNISTGKTRLLMKSISMFLFPVSIGVNPS